ncbi:chloramphenicol acetyltransferase [Sneathiella sp.]|jgi:phosphonate metabolism protein (transferase hexapeptide repeat family)|uniref:chloramphenicol acetyltransferase n=1 Tax=Sneathiella sp. TaxID=1964365 RepID=UPI0039E6217E
MIDRLTDNQKKLGPSPSLHSTATVLNSELGCWTEVGERTKITETSMGDYSYVVNDSDIIYSKIGKFVNIAAHVRINPGQHPMDRASLHHFQYRSDMYGLGEDDQGFFESRRSLQVVIDHDVWIGHGVTVQGGVRIGTGAIIGSAAVVTKDVPPYTIITGVPGTVMRERFSQEVRDSLLRIQWWHWSHDLLKARLSDFRELSAQEFCCKFDVE